MSSVHVHGAIRSPSASRCRSADIQLGRSMAGDSWPLASWLIRQPQCSRNHCLTTPSASSHQSRTSYVLHRFEGNSAPSRRGAAAGFEPTTYPPVLVCTPACRRRGLYPIELRRDQEHDAAGCSKGLAIEGTKTDFDRTIRQATRQSPGTRSTGLDGRQSQRGRYQRL